MEGVLMEPISGGEVKILHQVGQSKQDKGVAFNFLVGKKDLKRGEGIKSHQSKNKNKMEEK